MKQIVNYKNYFAILIIAILFSACKNKDEVLLPNSNQNMSISSQLVMNPLDSIGYLHNEMCDYYKRFYQTNVNNRYFSYNGESYLTMDAYSNMVESMKDYLINKKYYNSVVVNIELDEIYSLFQDYDCFKEINGQIYFKIINNYKDFLEYLETNNIIDEETYSYLEPIYKNEYPYTDINCSNNINNIRVHLIETNWENETLAKYLSVYEYSDLFWTSELLNLPNPDTLICGINPDQALILADALGACVGGGLFAVISSAVMSMAEAEDQEHHRSILVGAEYKESYYYPGNGGNPKK